jgi:antitoxin VapB
MALSVRSERVGHMARDLAKATGETLTEAVERSTAERLARYVPQDVDAERRRRNERIMQIVEEAQAMSRA